jgi:transcriptional regulator with XRE-family HTH domain
MQARELREMNQTTLASKTGIPASSISHFEAATRKPSFDNLRRIAIALNVSTDFLLGRADTPDQSTGSDELHRDAQKLNERDRELVKDFIRMLKSRSNDGKAEWQC